MLFITRVHHYVPGWCYRWVFIFWLLADAKCQLLQPSVFEPTAFVNEVSEEKRLCKELMANYTNVGVNGRPVVNISQNIKVEFGLGLIQMDLDEKNKILASSMWSRYKWHDDYLRWKPSDYGGIFSIKLAARDLWKPDVMMYNTADTERSEREVLAVVLADGTVRWVPHQIFKSSCSIDVTNFPFDDQVCHMWFGSWTYNLLDLDLQLAFPDGIDLGTFMSDYKESCAWEIVNTTAERKALPEESPTYVVLAFTLQMRRKLVFMTYILTLPCIFLASLTLVVFWLPPDRPDRTSLAMSLFASFLVLLLILVEAAPPTASSVPTLGVYYCFNMVIIMTSIFLSTVVVNIYRGGQDNSAPPAWIRMVMLNGIGRLLCVKLYRRPKSTQSSQVVTQAEENHRLLNESRANQITGRYDVINLDSRNSKSCNCPCEECVCRLRKDLEQMRSTINGAITSLNASLKPFGVLETTMHQQEWRSLAQVLDRLFFLLYLVVITFSLIMFFPRPSFNE